MANYSGLVTVDISSYENFKAAILGNGYDVDGVFGFQCVDLAKLLAGNAGRTSPYWKSDPDGYAYEGWTNTTNRDYNQALYFNLVYSRADVKKGDLVVLQGNTTFPSGHIAFADSDWTINTAFADLLGQNQVNPNYTTGHITTLTNVNVSGFLGAFRLKAWHPTPSNYPKSKFKWVLYSRKLRNKY